MAATGATIGPWWRRSASAGSPVRDHRSRCRSTRAATAVARPPDPRSGGPPRPAVGGCGSGPSLSGGHRGRVPAPPTARGGYAANRRMRDEPAPAPDGPRSGRFRPVGGAAQRPRNTPRRRDGRHGGHAGASAARPTRPRGRRRARPRARFAVNADRGRDRAGRGDDQPASRRRCRRGTRLPAAPIAGGLPPTGGAQRDARGRGDAAGSAVRCQGAPSDGAVRRRPVDGGRQTHEACRRRRIRTKTRRPWRAPARDGGGVGLDHGRGSSRHGGRRSPTCAAGPPGWRRCADAGRPGSRLPDGTSDGAGFGVARELHANGRSAGARSGDPVGPAAERGPTPPWPRAQPPGADDAADAGGRNAAREG
ncbi:hypothetical protein ABVK25_012202 [Lepraria finkii]|uniref:LigA n=1 Tax=Lepraria finkii TaxID=1340010 RepID=A0ABR4AH88_9LECA